MSINYSHKFANVTAIQLKSGNVTEVISWFSDEIKKMKFSFFDLNFDTLSSKYVFSFKYHSDTYNSKLEYGDYLVRLGDMLCSMTKEEFEDAYGEENTPPPPVDDLISEVKIEGNILSFIAKKEISGFSILGTGMKTGVDEYAHFIKVVDLSAPSSATPMAGLGEYKWIVDGNTEPTTTTTSELATLSTNQSDNTRALVFQPLDMFEVKYMLNNDKKSLIILDVNSSLFLETGSIVTVTYTDGTSYTKTMYGVGTITK